LLTDPVDHSELAVTKVWIVLTDRGDVAFGQGRVNVGFTLDVFDAVQSGFPTVPDVFPARDVFQVFRAVVPLVSVLVIDLYIAYRDTEKSGRYCAVGLGRPTSFSR
jgi:hypothetical protein